MTTLFMMLTIENRYLTKNLLIDVLNIKLLYYFLNPYIYSFFISLVVFSITFNTVPLT